MNDARDMIAHDTETNRLQRIASDPANSAWVSANAGSGKTEVLVRRVMRLMLADVAPQEILCLTYTKAAAAVMTNRVFERLATWITLGDEALRKAIADLTGEAPQAATMARARRLFADALETPGGLKIQTIHAFCERLLHLFPFDANVPAHFEVLDDVAQGELLDQAIADIAADRTTKGSAAADAFARVAEDVADRDFRDLLMKALAARVANDADRDTQLARLAAALGLDESETPDAAIDRYCKAGFRPDACKAVFAALMAHPGKVNDDNLSAIESILAAGSNQEKHERARRLFLKEDGKPRAETGLLTKNARAGHPEAAAALDAEAARFAELCDRLAAIETLARNRALYIVADAALEHYRKAKARRGALDFSDLIDKTRALFANDNVSPWILYKLDSRLSHILVDEAQDTSDAQWEIIRRLAEEFTAGAGARAVHRTIFAVGDEKQSIYGFQGAAPRSFAETRRHFKTRHDRAGQPFEPVVLKVSFRSTREVLNAVDRIFSGAQRDKGLTFDAGEPLAHVSDRRDIGFVELWPLVTRTAALKLDDYLSPPDRNRPVDALEDDAPQVRLAQRIALNAQLLIANGDPAGRAVTPGDIMILVRRRGPLFQAIIAALKRIGVPVAGADRLNVAQHIAVMDCAALARAALSPDDDHALACALKSPLIGLDDDDLLAIAPRRPGSLFAALRAAASGGGKFADACAFIDRWRKRAAQGPFTFFARLLDSDGGRRRLVARLGAEAGDALDEFLARALDFERRDTASLATFLAGFADADIEIKRDLDQASNEVRVMTVHAAKGLEAPIVILPDTTSDPAGGRQSPLVDLAAAENVGPLAVWAPAGAAAPPVKSARNEAKAAAEDEHRRLLYVALTRAKNGLIIAGACGRDAAPANCWFTHIEAALREGDVRSGAKLVERPARDRRAEPSSYWMLPGREFPEPAADDAAAPAPIARRLPAWTETPPAAEGGRAPPLSPSHATEAADRPDRPFDRPDATAARARGKLAHRLLETMPDLPEEARAAAALALANRMGTPSDDETRRVLVTRTLAILADRGLAELFGPSSRAEVTVAGPVRLPDGRIIHAAGAIDRLAASEDAVLIADYKTSARPPTTPADTPRAIIAQLALYRALVQPLYPGRRVRCLVIWTAGPLAHELSDAALDEALGDL